jgi:hypothetical protein
LNTRREQRCELVSSSKGSKGRVLGHQEAARIILEEAKGRIPWEAEQVQKAQEE